MGEGDDGGCEGGCELLPWEDWVGEGWTGHFVENSSSSEKVCRSFRLGSSADSPSLTEITTRRILEPSPSINLPDSPSTTSAAIHFSPDPRHSQLSNR